MAQVFISYSKSDWIAPDGSAIPGSPVGRVLAALEEAGVSYWIDREGLGGGVTFAERIAAKESQRTPPEAPANQS